MGLQFQRELRVSSTTLPEEFDTVARSLGGQKAVFTLSNHPSRLWVLDGNGEITYSSYVRSVATSIHLPANSFAPAFWVRRPQVLVERNFRIGGTLVGSIMALPWEQLLHGRAQYSPFTLRISVADRQRIPISDQGGLIEIEIATDNEKVAEQVKIWLGGFVAARPATTYSYVHELVYFFRPPVQSATYFPEGVLVRSAGLLERLANEPDLLSKHVLIVGQSGYGKTNTTKLLLGQAVNSNNLEGLLILDPKGEYRDWATTNNVLFIPAGNRPEELRKLHVNPFVPPRSQRLDSYLDMLSVIFSVSVFGGGGANLPGYMRLLLQQFFQFIWNVDRGQLRRILRATGGELLEQGYYRTGTTENLLEQLCDYWHSNKGAFLTAIAGNQIGSNLADLSGAITARIRALETSLLSYFDYSPAARSMGNLLGQKVVISLKDASEGDIDLIISLLAIVIIDAALLRDGSDRFRNLVVIEEAHRVMARSNNDSAEFVSARQRLSSTFQRAFREIRSSGVGLIAIDQSPHTLIDEAFANTSVKIAHHLELHEDQELINRLFQTKGINLASFGIGECLIKIDADPAYQTQLSRWNMTTF